MSASRRSGTLLVLVLLAAGFAWTAPAFGADASDSLVLVATPKFLDPVYSQTILIVKPFGDGQHVGFILNKPSESSVAEIFAMHGASTNVRAPVYFGGPADLKDVFALVQSDANLGKGFLPIAPNLYLVAGEETLAGLIDKGTPHVRFFAGAVVWKPGELDEELKGGAWYVLGKPDPGLLLQGKTEGLWERLVQQAEISANAI